MEISKELIIKVMDIKYPFSDIQLNSNILSWWREDVFFEETMKINIYEFAFKCKEWARKNKYRINSMFNTATIITSKMKAIGFKANSEVEAIIEACEWILE